MTWFAVYETTGGRLRSLGTVIADPLPAGLSSKDVGETQPDGVWNESTLDFDPRPVKRVFSPRQLAERFTKGERIAFRTSANQNVQDVFFLMFLEGDVDLDNAIISQGLALLETVGILATGRVDEIRGE